MKQQYVQLKYHYYNQKDCQREIKFMVYVDGRKRLKNSNFNSNF